MADNPSFVVLLVYVQIRSTPSIGKSDGGKKANSFLESTYFFRRVQNLKNESAKKKKTENSTSSEKNSSCKRVRTTCVRVTRATIKYDHDHYTMVITII